MLIIYVPVTATDKNDVVSVSESRKVFIEEANYPDLVQCDIVARYGMVLRALSRSVLLSPGQVTLTPAQW